ncbi:MAG TPA: isoprenoid biosynthesis glyoxalase ElbB, partial [Bacteroidales bacterium]|nr:isoprenoid biosynthesis glyoxalase ElbB [Bacteroidales bacterium]
LNVLVQPVCWLNVITGLNEDVEPNGSEDVEPNGSRTLSPTGGLPPRRTTWGHHNFPPIWGEIQRGTITRAAYFPTGYFMTSDPERRKKKTIFSIFTKQNHSAMKFAVVLSGCGVYDGSEIHEAVMTLLAIDKNGCSYEIFAPNIMQHHVVNHLTGEVTGEKRNVLVESARIARGKIKALVEYRQEEFDGLIFPGGFGAAKNLSSYAFDGTEMKTDKVVESAVRQTHAAGKPIGALCIAPVVIASILGNIEVTIGNDPSTAAAIKKLGAIHRNSDSTGVVIDEKNRIVTTPCYMTATRISEIAEGADRLVKALIKLAGK